MMGYQKKVLVKVTLLKRSSIDVLRKQCIYVAGEGEMVF